MSQASIDERADSANGTDTVATGSAPSVQAKRESLSAPQLIDAWEGAVKRFAALVHSDEANPAWVPALDSAAAQIRALALAAPDTALYVLLQGAMNNAGRYSTQHATLCAIVCCLCAAAQGWSAEDAECILKAALTMNLSIAPLQDTLAQQQGPLSESQRSQVDRHSARSAEMLAGAGVTDACWLEVVRCHHDPRGEPGEASTGVSRRLVELLHRVDVYTAKLSRRASREAVTPSIAARDVCLGFNGVPDEVGATILRTLGLFPPGSFVELANGEIGVVVSRGDKAHTPLVVALRRGDGGVHLQPLARDTARPEHAILRGVSQTSAGLRLNHGLILKRAFRPEPGQVGLACAARIPGLSAHASASGIVR